MLPLPLSNAAIAERFVAANLLGEQARPAAANVPNRLGIHQGFKHQTLVPVTRLEDKGQRPAPPITPDTQFRAASALGAVEGFRFGVSLCTGGMLVDTHDGAVNNVDSQSSVR